MITEFKCSLCNGLMYFFPDREGGDLKTPGMVICKNACDPHCKENVYGHSNSAKDAYIIACQKFRKV